MRISRLIPLAAIGLLSAVLIGFIGDHPAQAQGGNLLTNPGFEGAYSSYTPEMPQEQADCSLGVCTTAQVPSGWKPWWVKERPTDVNPEFKPATRNVAGDRVRSGDRASQYFSFWSTHKAGLRQTVTVPANSLVQFSIWGHAWMSEADNAVVSDMSGTPNMQIGIDPTGGINPFNPAVVWSGFIQAYDTYQQFSVQAQAQGDKVTVFTFSNPSVNPNSPDYGFKHTDIYWDDASLVVVGGGSAAAPPPPSPSDNTEAASAPVPAAPVIQTAIDPTATPDAEGIIYAEVRPGDSIWAIAARSGITLDEILELNDITRDAVVRAGELLIVGTVEPSEVEAVEAEATPEGEPTEEAASEETAAEEMPTEPAEEPTAEAEVQEAPISDDSAAAKTVVDVEESTVSICLTAYDDGNQNGIMDGNESLRPAVAFTISDGQSVVSNYVSDGENEPFCVQGLEAGSYRISRSSLPNEVLTTPGDQAVSLTSGGSLNLYFGSYMGQDTVATGDAASQTPETTATPDSSYSIIAIVAVVVAILLLAGVVLLVLTRQRQSS